jgi:hypothetical protein
MVCRGNLFYFVHPLKLPENFNASTVIFSERPDIGILVILTLFCLLYVRTRLFYARKFCKKFGGYFRQLSTDPESFTLFAFTIVEKQNS